MLKDSVILDENNQLISISVCSIETPNEHEQEDNSPKR